MWCWEIQSLLVSILHPKIFRVTRFHQVKCIFLPTTFHVNSWNNMLLISSKCKSKPKAEKNVERLGPNKGYERETSQRKQMICPITWQISSLTTNDLPHSVTDSPLTPKWCAIVIPPTKNTTIDQPRWLVYTCWSLVRILCLAQAFQHFFLL